jgi:branched-chain amino acid aminotransferase
MSSSLAVDSSDKSYSLYIPRTLRTSESSMPPSIKAGGNYLNSRYAKLEAIENGFDDALLVNHQGFISESTGSCVFFIMDNALLTPSLDCDILASITRHRIITICRQNGVKVLEGKFRSDDIQEIQGAFLCGSMIELMPISRIGSLKMATVDLKLYQSVLKLFKNSINTENL